MPASFERCIKEGGKVRTKRISETQYIHICWDKDGKSYSGEVKTYQRLQKKKK